MLMGSYNSDNRTQVLNFSSVFLIESSDDSEADPTSKMAALVEKEEDRGDAESICNDSTGCAVDRVHEFEFCGDDECESAVQDECLSNEHERPREEEDEEDGEVNMSAKRRKSKSRTCIHNEGRYSKQPANEMERNKIFWETCLASGF